MLLVAAAGLAVAACQSVSGDKGKAETADTETAGVQRMAARSGVARAVERVPVAEPIVVPEGTRLALNLETAASSATSHVGDVVVARLADPVRAGDRLVLPEGSEVRGRVTAAVPSGRVKGRARLAIDFDRVLVKGREIAIAASPVDITAAPDKKRDAAMIAGGAGAGAIVGGIAKGGKGAAIGALLGGAAGGGAVLATKGHEVRLSSGTSLRVRLDQDLRVG
jgi:hypothetical protein